MKHFNNKGFSLIELLAVVAILGILFGLGVQAYSAYIDQSRNKAYLTLVQSGETAMNNYLVDHSSVTQMTYAELYEQEYLERPTDPGNKIQMCKGRVTVTTTKGTGKALDTYTYTTDVCCTNYIYRFTNNRKVKQKLDSCPF